MADKVAKADPALAVKVAHGDVSLPKAHAAVSKPPKKPKRELPTVAGPEYEVDNLRASVQALSEQNEHLEARLAVEAMDASEDEKTSASVLIGELQSQVRTLQAEVDALRSMRDSLLTENGVLKQQCAAMTRRLKKLEQPA
jgi:FtsZ-binding cell division protein ZapB